MTLFVAICPFCIISLAVLSDNCDVVVPFLPLHVLFVVFILCVEENLWSTLGLKVTKLNHRQPCKISGASCDVV